MEPGVAGARETLTIQAGTIQAGNGVELRPVSLDHAEALYALIDRNRLRLREWLPWVISSYCADDLIAFIRDRERDNAERKSLTTVIFADGEMCGAIGLHAIDKQHRNTSIGYWIDAGYEGRGIVTQVCRAIVTEGFRNYGLHRIVIQCGTGNAKSSAIARRLGFVEEGILRQDGWIHDRWEDVRVFSMLEHEWR